MRINRISKINKLTKFNKCVNITKKTSGFTLVEMIIVIAILLVLSALATISIRGFLEEGERTQVRTDAEQLAAAFNMYNATLRTQITDKSAMLSEKTAMQEARLWPVLATPEENISEVLALITFDTASYFFIVP